MQPIEAKAPSQYTYSIRQQQSCLAGPEGDSNFCMSKGVAILGEPSGTRARREVLMRQATVRRELFIGMVRTSLRRWSLLTERQREDTPLMHLFKPKRKGLDCTVSAEQRFAPGCAQGTWINWRTLCMLGPKIDMTGSGGRWKMPIQILKLCLYWSTRTKLHPPRTLFLSLSLSLLFGIGAGWGLTEMRNNLGGDVVIFQIGPHVRHAVAAG